MNTFALWRLFHRPGTRGTAGHTSVLAVVAFAAATTIFLTVLGGVHGVNDMVVVDTPDALLIAPRARSQEVKSMVAHLDRLGAEDIL